MLATLIAANLVASNLVASNMVASNLVASNSGASNLGASHLIAANLVAPGTLSRFERANPLPALPGVYLDRNQAAVGVAQTIARAHRLQARVLWIDATANLARMNSDQAVEEVMSKTARAGFNTVVVDVKPIVGRTIYPSTLTEQLVQWPDIWRGGMRTMPAGYDPLAASIRYGRRHGLSVLVSLNAFSEGHRMALTDDRFGDPGWGFRHPELQAVQMVTRPTAVSAARGSPRLDVHPEPNPTQWSEPLAVFHRQPAEAEAFVLLNGSGIVLPPTVRLPWDGSVLVGQGEGAEFLRRYGQPGARIRLVARSEFRPSGEVLDQIPLMMNMHHPQVQQRALDILRDLVTRYDVDGVLYDDRLRQPSRNGDFSELTRRRFEAHVGRQLEWPRDIFEITYSVRLGQGMRPGPYYDAWLAWRAAEMRSFVQRARQAVTQSRPGTLFGLFHVGWYADSPRLGMNYASDQLRAGFTFLNADFRRTGFASDLDLLITGCYYHVATVHEAMSRGLPVGQTVEAGGILSNRVVRDQCWTYAGIDLLHFRHNNEALMAALQAAVETTQGVMVYDLFYAVEGHWHVFERAFRQRAIAPHTRPDLLRLIRQRRDSLDRMGHEDPPFPFFEGAPGVGE